MKKNICLYGGLTCLALALVVYMSTYRLGLSENQVVDHIEKKCQASIVLIDDMTYQDYSLYYFEVASDKSWGLAIFDKGIFSSYKLDYLMISDKDTSVKKVYQHNMGACVVAVSDNIGDHVAYMKVFNRADEVVEKKEIQGSFIHVIEDFNMTQGDRLVYFSEENVDVRNLDRGRGSSSHSTYTYVDRTRWPEAISLGLLALAAIFLFINFRDYRRAKGPKEHTND